MIYTTDQNTSIDAIKKFYQSEHNFFILSGYAGTGKTSTVKRLHEALRPLKLVYTAPTNKATKVLFNTIKTDTFFPVCKTTHSLLGLSMVKDGQYKVLKGGDRSKVKEYDIVIVDEASMVNTELFTYLIEQISYHPRVKVIFIGDPAQLPPVSELCSPIWRNKFPESKLTKVLRHDSSILNVATYMRSKISRSNNFSLEEFENDDQLLITDDQEEFENLIRKNARNFFGRDKIITWRNSMVDYYNKIVRDEIFKNPTEIWLPTDRFILLEAIKLKGKELFPTSTEGTVLGVSVTQNPKFPRYMSYKLSCLTEDNEAATFYLLHEESKEVYEEQLKKLLEEAVGNKFLWSQYWSLKEAFHSISHGYSLTSHRSQGSTYEEVYVDVNDILLNGNKVEAMQCLYVASTRPSKKLILNY